MCIIAEATCSNFYNGKIFKKIGLERKFVTLNFLNMTNVNYKKMNFIKYECINNDLVL